MKSIEILVSPTGQVTVATNGFSGSSCQEASRFLEQALGRRNGECLTAAFYETAQQGAAQQQHH